MTVAFYQKRLFALVIAFAVAASCSKRSSPPAGSEAKAGDRSSGDTGESIGGADTKSPPGDSIKPGSQARPARPAPVSQSEANAWLSAWLKAQDDGSFAAYSAMYGAEFTGVRRTKERAVTLDRAGWLADRKRMFRKPMQVSAEAIRFVGGEHHGVLRFVQVWKSGSYADRGEKEIILARGAAGVLALREDMLSSYPLASLALAANQPAPVTPAIFTAARFYPDQAPALLLPATWNWRFQVKSIGAPEAVLETDKSGQKSDPVGVRRRLDAATLPPEFEKLRGHDVELLTASGKTACRATIGEFYHAAAFSRERAQYVGKPTWDEWRALAGAGKLEELGQAMWKRGQTGSNPLATIAVTGGDCKDATWARLPGKTPPRVGVEVSDGDLAETVAEKIWVSDMYSEYTAKYELEEPPYTGTEWDEMLEESIEVTLYGFDRKKPTLALLQTKIGSLTYVVDDGGKLQNEAYPEPCDELVGAVDADGDGVLDLLTATTFGTGCLEPSTTPRIRF